MTEVKQSGDDAANGLKELSAWDNRPRDSMPMADMLYVIENNETCVFTRLRSDGHPIGAVVGGGLMDGEIYTSTNLFRAAYKNVQRDNRVSAIFDIPDMASVTVIGRAEIVDDMAKVRRFFELIGPRSWSVRRGSLTMEDYMKLAFTPNRRLFHIVPEKFIASDQRNLVPPATSNSA